MPRKPARSKAEVKAIADRAENSLVAKQMATSAERGKPTEYRDGFASEIITLMATGLSLTAAAANLGFHKDTIYQWEKKHPDFADALKLARGKRTLFLEKQLLAGESSPKVTAAIFGLKNAMPHEWRDRIEHTGKDGEPLEAPTDQLARALAFLMAEAKARQLEAQTVIEGQANGKATAG